MDNSQRKPINKIAAIVTGRGFEYEPEKKNNKRELWSDPPPTKPIPRTIKNLSGLKKGRLTVVGYLGAAWKVKQKKTKLGKPYTENVRRNKWLVRCTCGRYEVRTQETLMRKSTQDVEDMCQICLDLIRMRDKDQRPNIYLTIKKIGINIFEARVTNEEIRKQLKATGNTREEAFIQLKAVLSQHNIRGRLIEVK